MMHRNSYDDDEVYREPYRPRRFNPPEKEAIDGQQEGDTRKKKSKKLKTGGEEEEEEEEEGERLEEEDPLAVLAKKMGRAGKYFWRKMSIGGKGGKSIAEGDNKNMKAESVLALKESSREFNKKHQGAEESLGSVWMGEVKEQYGKTHETEGKGSVDTEPTFHKTSSISLSASELVSH